MRTLIKGGTIVNADATTRADVLVDGERIALIGEELDTSADRTVNAAGKWVIPGAIDFANVAEDIGELVAEGAEVIVVSSGATTFGKGALFEAPQQDFSDRGRL